MECLMVGRQSFRRVRVFSTPFSYQPIHSFTLNRQCASASSSRRMTHSQTSNHNRGSLKDTDTSQAYPLSGYYALILNSASPYRGRAKTERPTTPSPEVKPAPTNLNEAKTPQEKMAIVFGTRLAGPGRESRYNAGEMPPESEWKTINGVPIPPRPEDPENCCMSGCVHCVWDDFGDELEEWAGRVAQAKAKGGPEKGTKDMRTAPRAEVDSASLSMDDDGGGSEANWPAPSQDEDLFANIPVGIREFMKTEKKLRDQKQTRAAT